MHNVYKQNVYNRNVLHINQRPKNSLKNKKSVKSRRVKGHKVILLIRQIHQFHQNVVAAPMISKSPLLLSLSETRNSTEPNVSISPLGERFYSYCLRRIYSFTSDKTYYSCRTSRTIIREVIMICTIYP